MVIWESCHQSMSRHSVVLPSCLSILVVGLELTFFSGVYGTCIGNTRFFEPDNKSLIGLCGIFIGVGEVLGMSFMSGLDE